MAAGGWGLSAFHVVDVTEPEKLRAGFGNRQFAPITDIEPDKKKRDLARYRIKINGGVHLELVPQDVLIGEGVFSWRYPLHEDGGARYLKGHISRFLEPFGRGEPSYELSFEVARGISDSPLLLYHNGVKVTGLVYGNGRSEIVDDYVEEHLTSDKKEMHIVKRVISYGLAYRLQTLRDLLNQ